MNNHEYDPESVCDYVPPDMAVEQTSQRWLIAAVVAVLAIIWWAV